MLKKNFFNVPNLMTNAISKDCHHFIKTLSTMLIFNANRHNATLFYTASLILFVCLYIFHSGALLIFTHRLLAADAGISGEKQNILTACNPSAKAKY